MSHSYRADVTIPPGPCTCSIYALTPEDDIICFTPQLCYDGTIITGRNCSWYRADRWQENTSFLQWFIAKCLCEVAWCVSARVRAGWHRASLHETLGGAVNGPLHNKHSRQASCGLTFSYVYKQHWTRLAVPLSARYGRGGVSFGDKTLRYSCKQRSLSRKFQVTFMWCFLATPSRPMSQSYTYPVPAADCTAGQVRVYPGQLTAHFPIDSYGFSSLWLAGIEATAARFSSCGAWQTTELLCTAADRVYVCH